MKTKYLILVISVTLVLVGLAFYAGTASHGWMKKESKTLSPEYIQSWGFKQIQGGGMIKDFTEIIPGSRTDTLVATMTVIPITRDSKQLYVLGFVQQNRFLAVDAIYDKKDFDRWVEFLSQGK